MSTAAFASASPRLYDPQETLTMFQARQRHAYALGKRVREERAISAEAHEVYARLVRYVGHNRYAWVGVQRLAEEHRCSTSTIKRRLRELVRARLIRRARCYGDTSETYLMAYDAPPTSMQPLATDASEHEASGQTMQPVCPEADQSAIKQLRTSEEMSANDWPTPSQGSTTSAPVEEATLPPFFGVDADLTMGSDVRPHTEDPDVNTSGCGGRYARNIADEESGTQAVQQLHAAGVVDADVLRALKDCVPEQVAQVVHYVARCRAADDPRRPGLIVHLLRQGWGLHKGPAHEPTRGSDRALQLPARHVAQPRQRQPTQESPVLVEDGAGNASLDPQWAQVLTLLQPHIPSDALHTWLGCNRLLLLEEDLVVLGTPNVFVKEEVEARYRDLIEAAVCAVFNRPLGLEVVIGLAL